MATICSRWCEETTGPSRPKTNTCVVWNKSGARCKVTLDLHTCLRSKVPSCYVKHDKTSTFYSTSSNWQCYAAAPGQCKNHAKQTTVKPQISVERNLEILCVFRRAGFWLLGSRRARHAFNKMTKFLQAKKKKKKKKLSFLHGNYVWEFHFSGANERHRSATMDRRVLISLAACRQLKTRHGWNIADLGH